MSSMDITSAYTHLEIKSSDREKAAFSYQGNHYQPARMIFGLRNAPSCWSRLMNQVVKGIKQVRILLDDLIIVTNGLDEHVKVLEEIFKRFIDIGLTLKPSKCFFNVEKMDYLGFELSKQGLKPLKNKIEAIVNYPAPKTKKALRRFIGLGIFYKSFVPNGMEILKPLTKLTGLDPFVWKSEQAKAFENFKNSLAKSTMLIHRDPNKTLVLVTDASDEGFAACLNQIDMEGKMDFILGPSANRNENLLHVTKN